MQLEDKAKNYDEVQEKLDGALAKIRELENKLALQDKCFEEYRTQKKQEIIKLQSIQHAMVGNATATHELINDLVKNHTMTLKLVEAVTIKQEETKSLTDHLEKSLENSEITRPVETEVMKKNIMSELENKTKRSRNVLLFNVSEPVEDTSFRRRNADKCKATDLIRSLDISPTPQLQRVHRLGKWSATEDKNRRCRPLLVELESVHQRDQVLLKACTLSNNLNPVKIKGDYTKSLNCSTSLAPTSISTKSNVIQISKNGVRPRVHPVRL
jgi:hypothetical protein